MWPKKPFGTAILTVAAVEIERRLDARLPRRALELAAAEVGIAQSRARRPFRNAPPLLRPFDAFRLAHRSASCNACRVARNAGPLPTPTRKQPSSPG